MDKITLDVGPRSVVDAGLDKNQFPIGQVLHFPLDVSRN